MSSAKDFDWTAFYRLKEKFCGGTVEEFQAFVKEEGAYWMKREQDERVWREYYKNLNKKLDAKTVATQTEN